MRTQKEFIGTKQETILVKYWIGMNFGSRNLEFNKKYKIFTTFHHSIFPFLDAKFIYIFLYPKFIHPNYKDLSKCLPSVYLF